jgi:hypothetical protein
MSFTVEQKSQLAKLMATENLRVEHQKIRTAKFDPKNRVLYLPVWQNMTGVLYDLLTGHEVGHALYTPAEGWHDVASDKSKGKHYKHFLNVVEDARIEKKVKRRYPGLKMSFQRAYMELMDRDFFGIADRNVNEMPFIDRLNIFTKSQYSATYIQFNDEELDLVSKVENLETWEDVLRVTEEVYAYSKNEQYQIQNQQLEFDDTDEEYEFSDEYSDEYSDDYDYEEDAGDQDGNGESSDESDESAEEGDEGDEGGKQLNRDKESSDSYKDQFEPECKTDETFRQNETNLLDEKCKEYVYVNVPKPILENIITPAKRVHELISKFYFQGSNVYSPYGGSYFYSGINQEDVRKWVNEFKQKNERYIGLLVKEFEMRKAAKSFSKSKLSDTGDIDINKLSTYKFDDNIFRKVMLTPKGKNHGLVLLLDRSGSMSNNMAGSIEQILVLAMFCRKVNIPFVMYGFGDSVEANLIDTGFDYDSARTKTAKPSFVKEEYCLAYDHVFLREYLNSKMSNSEFSMAVRNMIILKKSYEGGRHARLPRPQSEELSNTPLTQAIYATGFVMRQFRKQYNLDLTSLVVVHDGDSDKTSAFWKTTEQTDYYGKKIVLQRKYSFNTKSQNVILRDTEKKYEAKIEPNDYHDEELIAAMHWFKNTTDSKVFGFFITSDRISSVKSIIRYRFVTEDGKPLNKVSKNDEVNRTLADTLFKKMKEEKFLSSNNLGYDSFYLILGGEELKIDSDELEIDGKITTGKLKNAFMKMNKRKAINRVLVSKFIQGMAA